MLIRLTRGNVRSITVSTVELRPLCKFSRITRLCSALLFFSICTFRRWSRSFKSISDRPPIREQPFDKGLRGLSLVTPISVTIFWNFESESSSECLFIPLTSPQQVGRTFSPGTICIHLASCWCISSLRSSFVSASLFSVSCYLIRFSMINEISDQDFYTKNEWACLDSLEFLDLCHRLSAWLLLMHTVEQFYLCRLENYRDPKNPSSKKDQRNFFTSWTPLSIVSLITLCMTVFHSSSISLNVTLMIRSTRITDGLLKDYWTVVRLSRWIQLIKAFRVRKSIKIWLILI